MMIPLGTLQCLLTLFFCNIGASAAQEAGHCQDGDVCRLASQATPGGTAMLQKTALPVPKQVVDEIDDVDQTKLQKETKTKGSDKKRDKNSDTADRKAATENEERFSMKEERSSKAAGKSKPSHGKAEKGEEQSSFDGGETEVEQHIETEVGSAPRLKPRKAIKMPVSGQSGGRGESDETFDVDDHEAGNEESTEANEEELEEGNSDVEEDNQLQGDDKELQPADEPVQIPSRMKQTGSNRGNMNKNPYKEALEDDRLDNFPRDAQFDVEVKDHTAASHKPQAAESRYQGGQKTVSQSNLETRVAQIEQKLRNLVPLETTMVSGKKEDKRRPHKKGSKLSTIQSTVVVRSRTQLPKVNKARRKQKFGPLGQDKSVIDKEINKKTPPSLKDELKQLSVRGSISGATAEKYEKIVAKSGAAELHGHGENDDNDEGNDNGCNGKRCRKSMGARERSNPP